MEMLPTVGNAILKVMFATLASLSDQTEMTSTVLKEEIDVFAQEHMFSKYLNKSDLLHSKLERLSIQDGSLSDYYDITPNAFSCQARHAISEKNLSTNDAEPSSDKKSLSSSLVTDGGCCTCT